MFQIAVTWATALKYGDVPQFRWQPYFDLPKRTEKVSIPYSQRGTLNEFVNIPYTKNMTLVGYFQRHEYFDDIKEILINEVFKVPQDWQPNTICVHVRRGDFLFDENGNFPVQPVSYYMNALNLLNYKKKRVVFCSDDIEFCKENFPFAEFREFTDELSDIYFGANCESVVMSNSTFSFWMAYLNLNNRQIYFPLHWFNRFSRRNGYEICPKTWIGL